MYDHTAGFLQTTTGDMGRFVCFDAKRQTVVLEMDNRYLVEYAADEVLVPEEAG